MAALYSVGYGPRYIARKPVHPASGGPALRQKPRLFLVVLDNISRRRLQTQTIASTVPRVRAVKPLAAGHDFTAGLLLVAFQLLLLALAAGLPGSPLP